MPKLVWQCEACGKLHATCDGAAKCERSHPETKKCIRCSSSVEGPGSGDCFHGIAVPAVPTEGEGTK